MPGDRRDLVCSATDLGEAARRRLAQTVRRNSMTSGGIAQFAEPISETRCGVWTAKMRDQKRFDADGRRRIDNLAQLRMHRYFDMRFLATFGLPLVNGQHAVRPLRIELDMLPTDPYDIATPLPRIKQQRKGKPALCTDRMRSLEPLNLRFRPGRITARLHLLAHDAGCRINGDAPFGPRPLEHD